MKKLLVWVLVFAVVLTAATAYTESEYEIFEVGKTKTYEFLKGTYKVKMNNVVTGDKPEVNLNINGFKKSATKKFPARFEQLEVSIMEVYGANRAKLNLTWHQENTNPDDTKLITRNAVEDYTIKDKDFRVIFSDFDPVDRIATFEINDEEYELKMGEEAKLPDETIFKYNDLIGTSPRKAQLKVWVSDKEIERKKKAKEYDVVKHFNANQQETLEVNGQEVKVNIGEVSEGRASVTINGNELSLESGDNKTLESGIEVLTGNLVLRPPRSVELSLMIPEKAQDRRKVDSVSEELASSQVDTIEVGGKKINVKALGFGNNSITFQADGENFTLKQGEKATMGDLEIKADIVNTNLKPHTSVLEYTVYEKVKQEQKEEDTEKEEEETQEKEEEEVSEDNESISEEDIPEPELPEEDNEEKQSEKEEQEQEEEGGQEKEKQEVKSFSESAGFVWKSVRNFVGGLFR